MVEADIEGVSDPRWVPPFRAMLTSFRFPVRAGQAQQPGLSCSRFPACSARLHLPACPRIRWVLFRVHPAVIIITPRFPFLPLVVCLVPLFSHASFHSSLGYYRSRVSLFQPLSVQLCFHITPCSHFWPSCSSSGSFPAAVRISHRLCKAAKACMQTA